MVQLWIRPAACFDYSFYLAMRLFLLGKPCEWSQKVFVDTVGGVETLTSSDGDALETPGSDGLVPEGTGATTG
jgi:hypothetical protein